jgi:hypothetical protein
MLLPMLMRRGNAEATHDHPRVQALPWFVPSAGGSLAAPSRRASIEADASIIGQASTLMTPRRI